LTREESLLSNFSYRIRLICPAKVVSSSCNFDAMHAFGLAFGTAALAVVLQGCGKPDVPSDSTSTTTTTTTTEQTGPGNYDGSPKFMLEDVGMKSFSYNPLYLADPSCLKSPGVGQCGKIINDDVSAEWAEQMWGPDGRNDIGRIRQFGANAIRLYGNDPRFSKRKFFDELVKNDMKALTGMSNYPFTDPTIGCIWKNGYDCTDAAKSSYSQVLKDGEFAKNGYYHNAIEVISLMNEPDIHAWLPGEWKGSNNYIKALITAMDGLLEAEKEANIQKWKNGKLPKLTIAWSYAMLPSGLCSPSGYIHDKKECGPSIGFMAQFYWALQDPQDTVGYTPINDLKSVYEERWVNSLQPFQNTDQVYREAVLPGQTLPSLKGPKMYLGEYDPAVNACADKPSCPAYGKPELLRDLKVILSDPKWTKSIWGVSFFQYQMPYNKYEIHELQYGMFEMLPNAPWTTGYILGDDEKNHPINCLDWKVQELGEAVAEAYGGSLPDLPCPKDESESKTFVV